MQLIEGQTSKKEKSVKGLAGYFLVLFFGASSLLVCRLIPTHCLFPHVYKIVVDSCGSVLLQQEINEFVKNTHSTSDRADDRVELCTRLMQRFPAVQAITCCQKSNSHVLLNISVHRPDCIVNYNRVLLASGVLAHKDHFTQEAVDGLHRIVVNFPEEMFKEAMPALAQWLASSSSELFDFFEVHAAAPTKLQLIDKKAPIEVYCHYAEPFGSCELVKYAALKQEIQKLNQSKKPGKQSWIADVRFSNQVILYPKKGSDEGKRIF